MLGVCALTTYGRMLLGISTGVGSSRYTTHELLFIVSVLALGYLALGVESKIGRSARLGGIGILYCSVGTCVAFGYFEGFHKAALQ